MVVLSRAPTGVTLSIQGIKQPATRQNHSPFRRQMTQWNCDNTNPSKGDSSERKKAVLSVREKQEVKRTTNKVKVESLSISHVRACMTVAHAQWPTLTCQNSLKFETSVSFISASAG